MNFVDVQPNFSLDYAWTSPSPSVMHTTKSSKTNRKQNRCCDQCRKGKRACDAAILEDALLDDNRANGTPLSFHYSDVFGPLAPCGNCEKTKKNCTFEWLKSQRMIQSSQPPASTSPPTKRRRTSSGKSLADTESPQNITHSRKPPDHLSGIDVVRSVHPEGQSPDFGITFADFAGGPTAFDVSETTAQTSSSMPVYSGSRDCIDYFFDSLEDNSASGYCTSGKDSLLEAFSEDLGESPEVDDLHPDSLKEASNSTVAGPVRHGRKRRRRGSIVSVSNGAPPRPVISFTNHMVSSTNNAFLTENLLKIYHNSFENALSCWVTERTCPYATKVDHSRTADNGPAWNHIYYRVFRLDRGVTSIRGRQLTFTENTAATRALNLAIYAFAIQWAQSIQKSNPRYPFNSADSCRENSASEIELHGNLENPQNYERTIQINAWHEAHKALQSAGEIESFRVVLAQIVFALTQKPLDEAILNQRSTDDRPTSDARTPNGTNDPDQDMSTCENLMSKLNITMEAEGPPTHLEQGLRLIHSLRSRIAMSSDKQYLRPGLSRYKKRNNASSSLDNADRATVELLFWLGIMFDTLSAAMNKRPLVVSEEDSDVYSKKSELPSRSKVATDAMASGRNDGAWDDYLFADKDSRVHGTVTRWPCSFDRAAALLCDAAPIKVLLFRKITRIQTLITRNHQGRKVDAALTAALEVYSYWKRLYMPFIQDCTQNHDRLHPRIQSWYICLAGHWHLATLLLADLIEIVDETELGDEAARNLRASSDFVASFRYDNCQVISDIARCACQQDNSSALQTPGFQSAMHKEALLAEPWTAVLVRAFAKAGATLLEADTMLPINISIDEGDTLQRADYCVRALWYLGRKSDMAMSAALILGNALRERRRDAQEKVDDIYLLDNDVWHGFENLNGYVGLHGGKP